MVLGNAGSRNLDRRREGVRRGGEVRRREEENRGKGSGGIWSPKDPGHIS